MNPTRRAFQCLYAAGVVAMLAGCASTGDDATATLSRSAQAMGSTGLKTLRYSANGTGFTFGQAYTPGGVWPNHRFSSPVVAVMTALRRSSTAVLNRPSALRPIARMNQS